MDIKKMVQERIVKKLEDEQAKLRAMIRENKWEMNKLATKQTFAKRELAELQDLIRSMNSENKG